jgi:hypothetical protein
MATITSVINFEGEKEWSDTTAWQGGVVPTSADTAQIYGVRTTINQAAFNAWTGTRTITVGSTTNFPNSGSFYTYTDRSKKVKIDYNSKTTTQFLECSIDTTYFPWGVYSTFDYRGGSVANGSAVHYTPKIVISGGTVIAGIITITNGGYLKVTNNATLEFQNSIQVNEGTLEGTGQANFRFGYNNTSLSTGTVSRIIGANNVMSQIIMVGNENRSNGYLLNQAEIGDCYLTVSGATRFSEGDEIIISDPNSRLARIDDNFRVPFMVFTGDTDECLEVAGVSGDNVYVALKNTDKYKILETSQQNTNELIIDSTKINIGDKLVINNNIFTVQNVEDYDYLLRTYDFQNGATLDDWQTNTGRDPYCANFQIVNNIGLVQSATTAYRNIFVKDIFRKDVKVNAWISNYREVVSGTTDGGARGVCIQSDPNLDGLIAYDGFGRTYFEIDNDSNRYRIVPRATVGDNNHSLSLAGINQNGLKKITLESRKGFLKGYIDDVLYSETFMRNGWYNGRVGVFCNVQNSFSCTKFEVYATCQKVTLSSPYTGTTDYGVYISGIEYYHSSGSTVTKLASTIINPNGHFDLAYSYRGASFFKNDNIFPYIYNIAAGAPPASPTRTLTNGSQWVLNINYPNYDYASYSFGTNVSGSCVIDLTSATTFTHISFIERLNARASFLNNATEIQVSNNLTNWTTVYFAATDTRRRDTADSIRYYDVGQQTARYVRLIRGGGDSSTTSHRWTSFGVADFSNGYTIELSNTDDIDVDDRIMILYGGSYVGTLGEETFITNVINGTVPTTDYLTQIKQYYTVLSKTGNTITIDRIFNHGYLHGGEKVVKLNKNISFRGTWGTNLWVPGRLNLLPGTNQARLSIFKNVEFTNLTAGYPTNIASDYNQSGFMLQIGDTFNTQVMDGVSHYNCYPTANSYTGGFGYGGGNYIIRGSTFIGLNGRGWFSYAPSFNNAMYFVGNTFAYCAYNENYMFSSQTNLYFNYNDLIGIAGLPRISAFADTNAFNQTQFAEYKRNYVNGSTSYGIYLNEMTQGFGVAIRYIDANNRYEYLDDALYRILNYSPYELNNVILSDRMNGDNRLSRFTQMFDLSRYLKQHINAQFINNYNNYGYNLSNIYQTYIIKYPNEDYYRFYKMENTWQNVLMGLNIEILSSSATTVDITISMEYYNDAGQQYLTASENVYSGSTAFFTLKNGARLVSDSIVPKSLTSTTYTYNISFSGTGNYQVGLGQAARDGFVAFKNVKSTIKTNNPNDIYIYTNTFDLRQFKSGYPREYEQFNVNRSNQSLKIQGSRLY